MRDRAMGGRTEIKECGGLYKPGVRPSYSDWGWCYCEHARLHLEHLKKQKDCMTWPVFLSTTVW
jgi:hypothetical protein